ncbi:MAG: hypothetical protein KA248_00645 [Kiritimatiellae bacterium]|nr:hypothetical protein [Kiritimatiellia bacterium]
MTDSYKVKLTHQLPTGDSLTCEVHLKASSLDDARVDTVRRFQAACRELAGQPSLVIHKTKIEQGV